MCRNNHLCEISDYLTVMRVSVTHRIITGNYFILFLY